MSWAKFVSTIHIVSQRFVEKLGRRPTPPGYKGEFNRPIIPFLAFQVSRAGLFYGLSTGEFCPLPLFPSLCSGPGVSPIDEP
jgi:hypothetical protein